jgi:hypothetical protein
MQEQYVQDSEVRAALIAAYEDAVDSLLDDHVISEEEQSSLADYADALSLSRADLDRKGAYTNVGLGTVLREVTAGRLPQQQPMQGDLPFNFQKSEELVWTFQGVTLYEGRSRTRYEGGSPAVRVRVMKGVYLRQSAIRGDPVVTTELVHIDDGVVALTTKHLYIRRQTEKPSDSLHKNHVLPALQRRLGGSTRCCFRQASGVQVEARMVCLQPDA